MLVASPKVATYDLQPEMSAYEVAGKCVERIESGKYDVIILNFANCDMVGHTGVLLPGKDGGLLFIEKVAFQEPYRLGAGFFILLPVEGGWAGSPP